MERNLNQTTLKKLKSVGFFYFNFCNEMSIRRTNVAITYNVKRLCVSAVIELLTLIKLQKLIWKTKV